MFADTYLPQWTIIQDRQIHGLLLDRQTENKRYMINSRRHTTRCSAFECAIKYFIDIHLTDAKLTLEQPDKKLYKTCINPIAATSRSGTQAQLERCGIKRKIEQCKHCSTYHCSTKRTEHR